MRRAIAVAIVAAWTSGLPVEGQYARPRAANAPTYSKDVAPILYKHCTTCHRPGEIAPMSLLTYKEARPWAKSIRAEVALGEMPPWHADGAHGQFVNDRRLTDDEKETIAKWVLGGAPEGDPADLPPRPRYADGWTNGTPDAVFTMQEDYPIPAEGTVLYKYFEIATNTTEDRWIRGIEVRPGNRAVVHHVLVYARPPQPDPRPQSFKFADGMDVPAGETAGPPLPPEEAAKRPPNDRPEPKRLGSLIGIFTPGQFARAYDEGTGLRLAAGSTIVLQMHYTATGNATTDRTRVGLVFTPPPKTRIYVTDLYNGSLVIPAGATNYRVDAEMTVSKDMELRSLAPHTHLRGKRWEYQVIDPDGRAETILSVPKYDFNWQTEYIFSTPLVLRAGSKLHATAWYDNSANNLFNPDPTSDVRWGDQTWQEMMFTGFTYSMATPAATPSPKRQ